MSDSSDERYMRMALALGARGLGRVAPWPAVGCVLVKNGRIVGRGWTDRASYRHAERMALDQAGDTARGATAYVTLEPCSHHGTTPPCADALIAADIKRVVIAIADPNEPVNGQGIAKLRAAGINVETGLCGDQARASHSGFLKVVTQGMPHVTLKLAASLDGRIATISGESKWITGPQSRRFVHALRARHDAVLVGGGTARADDPDLRVRELGVSAQPTRVVMSAALDLPLNSKLASSANETPVIIVHGPGVDPNLQAAWRGIGATLIEVSLDQTRHLAPRAMLAALAQAGITRIFCEGGGALAASLLSERLVDDLYSFQAGKAMGSDARPMIANLGLERLNDAPEFDLVAVRPIGEDMMSHWRARQDT